MNSNSFDILYITRFDISLQRSSLIVSRKILGSNERKIHNIVQIILKQRSNNKKINDKQHSSNNILYISEILQTKINRKLNQDKHNRPSKKWNNHLRKKEEKTFMENKNILFSKFIYGFLVCLLFPLSIKVRKNLHSSKLKN